MQSLITILREVHDPRDFNSRHEVGTILFLALAATLCGAKTCVEMAEFVDGREEELSAIVDLPHGAPSHDTPSAGCSACSIRPNWRRPSRPSWRRCEPR
jgi:hypothetical protein